ncbi:hypothetical protein [Kineococcus aurantiacus]|uniref:hypothetical protein n=1 Tax=Kineococcus aurantiacus TaxID=37633 RepID=UPI0031E071B2
MVTWGSPTIRRRAVRGVFALAVLALPVQVAVRELAGEPYPGLYQPSFGGVPLTGGRATTTEAVIHLGYADGHTRRIPVEEALPPTGILPRYVLLRGFRDQRTAEDPRTVAWLRQRWADDPEGTVTAFDVQWQQVGYSVQDGSRTVLREGRHVHVDLGGAS